MEGSFSGRVELNLIQVASVFFILFFIGYPFAKYVEKYTNNKDFLEFTTLSPLIGASILIFEGLLISLNISNFKIYYSLGLGTLIFGFAYFTISNLHNKKNIKYLKDNWLHKILYLSPIILVYLVLTPSWNEKIFVRLNIDFPAYIAATEYLLDIPLNQVSADMANHILFQAHRWGLPIIASFIKVNSILNIYETLFSVIFILYISSILFFKDLFGYAITKLSLYKKKQPIERYKFLFFLCLLLNSPILFFTAEGFYPQIISISIISVIFAIFFLLRTSSIKSSFSIFLIITILLTALLKTYSQAITIYIPILLIIFILDLFQMDKEKLRKDTFFLFTILASFLIDINVLIKIISDQLNISSLTVGYHQPNWLFPSEILGLGSIYFNTKNFFSPEFVTQLVHRSSYNLFFSFFVSTAFIYLYFKYTKKINDFSLAAFPIFTFILFIADYVLSNSGQAQFAFAYNKIAVHFSAFFLMIIFLSLSDFSNMKNPIFARILIYIISFSIIFTGFLTLNDLKKFQSSFNLSSLNDLNYKLTNCDCILLPNERGMRYGQNVRKLRYVDRTKEGLIRQPIHIDVIDQWAPILVNSRNKNKRIFLLVFKENHNKSNLYDHNLFYSVYENDNFLILDTKKQMNFFVGKKQDEVFKWINSIYKNYNLSSN
jgi:hypothetical protein